MTTPSPSPVAPTRRIRIIFVHHSTGRILVREGGVRQLISRLNHTQDTNYEFWDHDYNPIGLTGAEGRKTGGSYDMPGDNTNPVGFEALFTPPVHDPPDNTLSNLLQYDVIVFKPCFPACAIRDDAQLEWYKRHYLAVRAAIEQHPDKVFIAMTPPPLAAIPLLAPLLPGSEQWTNPPDARRARAFAKWLVSGEFESGVPNMRVFDLFDLLAAPERSGMGANILKPQYRGGKRGVLGVDSHPNAKAARDFAPLFVDFLHNSIRRFRARPEPGVLSIQARAFDRRLFHIREAAANAG